MDRRMSPTADVAIAKRAKQRFVPGRSSLNRIIDRLS